MVSIHVTVHAHIHVAAARLAGTGLMRVGYKSCNNSLMLCSSSVQRS